MLVRDAGAFETRYDFRGPHAGDAGGGSAGARGEWTPPTRRASPRPRRRGRARRATHAARLRLREWGRGEPRSPNDKSLNAPRTNDRIVVRARARTLKLTCPVQKRPKRHSKSPFSVWMDIRSPPRPLQRRAASSVNASDMAPVAAGGLAFARLAPLGAAPRRSALGPGAGPSPRPRFGAKPTPHALRAPRRKRSRSRNSPSGSPRARRFERVSGWISSNITGTRGRTCAAR